MELFSGVLFFTNGPSSFFFQASYFIWAHLVTLAGIAIFCPKIMTKQRNEIKVLSRLASSGKATLSSQYLRELLTDTKGQIKPKADWRAAYFSKKWTNEYSFFLPWKAEKQEKTNSFLLFLVESTVRQYAYGFIWPSHTVSEWFLSRIGGF